jgi:MFS transporter, DHA1 family, putative efflux transporter
MQGLSKRPAASLAVGWLTMFVIGTDLFVISPLLPMIATEYRISPAVAGLAVTFFSLTYMIGAPFFGHLADRVGRRRVLIAGLAVFAAGNLATAAATNLPFLLAARIAAGAAAAAVSPSVYALVAGAALPERRASWMALVVSGLLVSLAVGAPIGAWVGAAFGWNAVFAALAALSFLLMLPNGRVWPVDPHLAEPAAVPLSALDAKALTARLLPMVLWSTGLYGMYTYLGTGLAAAGYSVEEIARVILIYGLGAIAGVLIGGRLADRLGARLMAAAGLLGLSACFIGLYLAVHAGMLVGLALGLTSAVAQLFFPAQQAGIAHDFPTRRASMMAWNNSALFFGIGLGSMLGGQAVAIAGFEADLIFASAVALIGFIVVGRVMPGPTAAGAAGRPV